MLATVTDASADAGFPARHALILAIALSPMAVYVYGALRLDWGLNELSGAFLLAGLVAGLVGGLGATGTLTAYLEGAQSLLPAALMIGVARSISLVLEDGRVVDTILYGLVTPLSHMSPFVGALLQIPMQALVHVAVPSVSGQAVLTMPLVVPLADLMGVSRQVPVLAYQTGSGLTELMTPTNGALMADAARGGRAVSALDPLRPGRRAAGDACRRGEHRRRDLAAPRVGSSGSFSPNRSTARVVPGVRRATGVLQVGRRPRTWRLAN